jgi:hypothetical protein
MTEGWSVLHGLLHNLEEASPSRHDTDRVEDFLSSHHLAPGHPLFLHEKYSSTSLGMYIPAQEQIPATTCANTSRSAGDALLEGGRVRARTPAPATPQLLPKQTNAKATRLAGPGTVAPRRSGRLATRPLTSTSRTRKLSNNSFRKR